MSKVLHNQKGMVLVVVLTLVTLLTSMLAEFAFSTLVDMRLAETYRDTTRAWYLAKGGVRAGRMLLTEDKNSYDASSEMWAQGITQYPVGDIGSVDIQIEDLGGKLNLNALVLKNDNPNVAQIYRFERLFDEILPAEAPASEELIDLLIDWIDRDNNPRSDGAEDDDYLSMDPPHHCKNGRISSLDELIQIPGFTSELIALLAKHVTAHGNIDPSVSNADSEKINVNTATAEVLMALDELIDNAAAEAIISSRSDAVFKTEQDLQNLNNLPGLENLLRTPFTVYSDTYRIRCQGWVNEGTRSMTAVVNKRTNKQLYQKVR